MSFLNSFLSGGTFFSCDQSFLFLQRWQVKWCTIKITLHCLTWYAELITSKWLYICFSLFFSFLTSQFWTLIVFFLEIFIDFNLWHDQIVPFDLTGIVPASTLLLDVYWKEMDADSDWVNDSIACFIYYSVCSHDKRRNYWLY